MAKSYILEIEGDKQKIEEYAKQNFDLNNEKANLIRENQNLRLENMELRRLRKQERKEKKQIRKQLIQHFLQRLVLKPVIIRCPGQIFSPCKRKTFI